MKGKVICFTDGSSLGNPGSGGWGAVILFPDGEIVERGGKAKHATNNQMELSAAIEALSYTEDRTEDVVIYSDSSYVINGATKWLADWKKNGWKTKQKKDVENKEFWEKLGPCLANRKIEWVHVSGHSGLSGNERADEIATTYADGDEPGLYYGSISDYDRDISDVSYDVSKKDKRDDGKARSRAKAFSYVSLVDGLVEVHQTWEECEDRVSGVAGARYKKSLNEGDEEKIIEEFSI